MTITQRLIRATKPAMLNENVNASEYLDSLAVTSMLGILHQLGQLSEFAAEVFEGLYELTSSTGARVSTLGSRIAQLDQDAAETERSFKQHPPSYYFNNSTRDAPFKRADTVEEQLFRAATLPRAMQKTRSEARPAPPLDTLNKFTAPEPAMKKFSNPGLFLEEWLKSEQEKQAYLLEERKMRRARRENKKGKEKKPRQAKIKVEAVQVKQYSAFGAEFAASPQTDRKPAPAAPAPPVQRAFSEPPPETNSPLPVPEPPAYTSQSFAPPPVPPPVPAMPAGGGPPPPIPQSTYVPPPPPVPPMPASTNAFPSAPPPPPVPSSFVAPSPPPFIPPAPVIPEAPPVPDGLYSSSGDLMAMPSDDVSGGGLGFLDQIRSGAMKNLKKTDVVSRRMSGRGGVLGEIKKGNFNLRKVDATPAPKNSAAAAAGSGGGLVSIMKLLERRQQITGSDDEESDEEEGWDD